MKTIAWPVNTGIIAFRAALLCVCVHGIVLPSVENQTLEDVSDFPIVIAHKVD